MPRPPETHVDTQTREVFAYFGLAIYLAQCLEHGIVNALLYAKLMPKELARYRRRKLQPFDQMGFESRFDLFMEQHFDQTIGQLVTLLRKATAVPADLDATLIEAKNTRNFLAHNYFRERAEQFISRAGCAAMLAELERAHQLFERADEQLRSALEPLAAKTGFTPEKLDQYQKEYFLKAYAAAAAIDAALADPEETDSSEAGA